MLILHILISILQKSNYCIQITANTSHERGFSSLNMHHFLRLNQHPVSLHTHCGSHSCPSGATSHISHRSPYRQLTAVTAPSAKAGSSTPLKHRSAASLPLTLFFLLVVHRLGSTTPSGAEFHLANSLGFQPIRDLTHLSHLQQTAALPEQSYYLISASFLQVVSSSAAKNTVCVKRQQN